MGPGPGRSSALRDETAERALSARSRREEGHVCKPERSLSPETGWGLHLGPPSLPHCEN